MGTVGLSFGSPTSGTGFDVSTTVASIVSNLQNVETPWKSQLTRLESQDTAISSLGTLFSNLSNDMSSLTDLQGIMAEKEGSSSDENVLTLTAANSSATAGTHTVEVQSLAQTSSGYLATVANSSEALSGSVTLQMGSGTAQTIDVPTTSGNNTLAGLAAAINSSGLGIIANVMPTSKGSLLSLVSGTSGAAGNITVSSNQIAGANQILSYTGTTGSTANGSLAAVGSSSDVLSGSIAIQAGSGTTENIVIGAAPSSGAAANTIYTGSGANTLADLASTIAGAGLGVTASVDSTGTVLTLDSGSNGTLMAKSSIVDTNSSTLGYTSTVTGADAQLTVDGITGLTSSSNTVANLIPGVTFQLLAPSAKESDGSLEQVQVVIANDNTGVESTIASVVSDYNALISAVNAQDGNDSSGNSEPLFGSPTLSLLQQQLLSGLNMQNPNGYLDSISNDTGTTLAGSIQIQEGSGAAYTVVMGPAPSSGAAVNTIYTGSGTGWNTLSGLVAAINAASPDLSYSDAAATSATVDSGTVGSVANSSDTLSGSISIAIGNGTAENVVIGAQPSSGAAANTIYTGSGVNTLSGIAGAINAAGIGIAATMVANQDGTFGLSLLSETAGTAGALAVTSSMADSTTSASLSYADTGYITPTVDTGIVGSVGTGNDALSGSIRIAVGSGAAQTIAVPETSGNNTLFGLAGAINDAGIGVTASVITNSDGTSSLSLVSQTLGSAGALTAVPILADVTTSANLSYFDTGYTNATVDAGSVGSVSNSGNALSGSISIAVGSGNAVSIVLGAAPTSGAITGDIYTGSASGDNTLAGVATAINNAGIGVTASVVTNNDGTSSLSLVSQTFGAAGTLSVTSEFRDGLGVTAGISTTGTQSTLTLASQTAGPTGALIVSSNISATSDALLSYTGTSGSTTTDAYGNTSTTTSTGSLTSISSAGDMLTGSISIQVGSGAAQTVSLGSSGGTLQSLVNAINNTTGIGVTAAIATNILSQPYLSLQSNTAGTAGTMTITSNILDTTTTSTSKLNYTNSSDVSTLANLGITISNSDNGTLSFDAASLDSVLNSDYSGVVGFFQNANSWGMSFSNILSNAGTGTPTGILALASTSNSNVESTLNADISKEDRLISAQQVSLTAELNSANEIMQELPTQLAGVNELYSAITGYNQNTGG